MVRGKRCGVRHGLLQELRQDDQFTDLTVECRDGMVMAHRAIWCKTCPKLFDKLTLSSPGKWCLKEKVRCSQRSLELLRDMMYSGRVDGDIVDEMSLEQQQECLSVARWLGMEYVREWMAQYLHGVKPEDVDPTCQIPPHWKKQPMPAQGWRAIPISEDDLLRKLSMVLKPRNAEDLGHGRDCTRWPQYRRLNLKKAWRVENALLWRKYDTERANMKELSKSRLRQMPTVHIRPELAESTRALPYPVCTEVNEVFLLHGTKPETAWCSASHIQAADAACKSVRSLFLTMAEVKHILNDGLNERFSGGLFGSGSYLAEAHAARFFALACFADSSAGSGEK